MSVLLKILWVNDILVPFLAFFCNILLLWLIKTVKTKNLIHINYSLIPNSFLDITASVFTFIVAPHIFYNEGYSYFVFGDLFGSIINLYIASYIAALYAGFFLINFIATTVSFYIRYLIICKDCLISIRTMMLPYFIIFIIFVIHSILFLWCCQPDFNDINETKLLTDFWTAEYNRSPFFFKMRTVSAQFLSDCGLILTVFTFAYSLMFYYSNHISKTLKSHVDNNNNNATKLLHKQIQRTLFIQAFGPALIGSIPLLIVFTNILIKLNGSDISLILSIFFPWISFFNPVAAIFFIKPYRNYVKTIFKPFLPKNSGISNNKTQVLPL